MAPISLKIVLDEGAVTRKVKLDSKNTVAEAQAYIREKLPADPGNDYALFLTSTDTISSGTWLENHRTLEHYMLRDGDSLFYIGKMRNLRVRMLDGSLKTIQVDQSKNIGELMIIICDKIGITNYDEYGLCHDEEVEIAEEAKPTTGTLTLKRKQEQVKDPKLEQLSKKLKTDDLVQWLDQYKTLREMNIDPKQTLLMKRRLYYSDRNVDARDPVQLNLLYVQTRDAILDGRQVVDEEKAFRFASIDCQIQFGDFHEEKHKSGFIKNLKEFLPENYCSSFGAEKKILREWGKRAGLLPLECKHEYIKMAQELPTYGVTCFLVKEKQKGKKKLIPRLLGISAKSILRLDETTKEVLQVWMLTQVKSYHAGKETFTLDFGDYSDKEYAVKTNESYRIRDILQGYIDIISKRQAGTCNLHFPDGQALSEDNVAPGMSSMMQKVVPMKVTEQSYVGPSKIIASEPGQQISGGTQIVTVQQIITTQMGDRSQKEIRSEVGLRGDMDVVKKLNRMNSLSYKTVNFLADPTDENIKSTRGVVGEMEENLTAFIEGIKETAQKKTNGDERKKLLDQLDEMCEFMNTLAHEIKHDDIHKPYKLALAEDAAKRIADLSTQMYFSIDPATRRRSDALRRSRKSFIADEKTEATLRRASFLAAAANTAKAINNAEQKLTWEWTGGNPEATAVERDALHKLGRLNAAVAQLMTAYADPKNIDYEAAVKSMNTINELLPELIEDARALGSVQDGHSRQELIDQIRLLCEEAQLLCNLTEDREKIRDAANEFGRASGKLSYMFRRAGPRAGASPDIDYHITELAKDVANKTSNLLMPTNKLIDYCETDPRVGVLESARAKCVDAAQGLLICAQLTAPAIHEAHCRSALAAAAEHVASSGRVLEAAWKPLADDYGHHALAAELQDRHLELNEALDRLNRVASDLSDTGAGSPEESDFSRKEGQRLRYIYSSTVAKNNMNEADKLLQTFEPDKSHTENRKDLQRQLAKKLAQLNAAIARLVQATSDRDNPDYGVAESAIADIAKLTPDIVKDAKCVAVHMDEKSRAALMDDLRAMVEANRAFCDCADGHDVKAINDVASKFAESSSKLVYTFNRRANPANENQILELSRASCEKASQMLANVYTLAEAAGGEAGSRLDAAGAGVVDAAQSMLTAAQVTAASISDPNCRAALLWSVDTLQQLSARLAQQCQPLLQEPRHRPLEDDLAKDGRSLQTSLDRLRAACKAAEPAYATEERAAPRNVKTPVCLNLLQAERNSFQLTPPKNNKAVKSKLLSEKEALERQLAKKLAELNAAIACLLRDRDAGKLTDAELKAVNSLTSDINKDAEKLSLLLDDSSKKRLLREIEECCSTGQLMDELAQTGQNKKLHVTADKFVASSERLRYILTPRNKHKTNKIVELSQSAADQALEISALLYNLVETSGPHKQSLQNSIADLSNASMSLRITANITAPTIEDAKCQAALQSSVEEVQEKMQKMLSFLAPSLDNPRNRGVGDQVDRAVKEMNDILSQLRNFGKEPEEARIDPEQERRRLQYVNTAKTAADDLLKAQTLMQSAVNPGQTGSLSNDDKEQLQRMLSQKLAELNSAVAALLRSRSDSVKPDYKVAEQSIMDISLLVPELVQDSRALSCQLDKKSESEVLEEMKELFDACLALCTLAPDYTVPDMHDSTIKFATSSGKLCYIFNPRANARKENEILDLSRTACEKASDMLSKVYLLAEAAGGEQGARLDAAGTEVVEAAQALILTAQVTSPTIGHPKCQSQTLFSVDAVEELSQQLAVIWTPLLNNHRLATVGDGLEKQKQKLNDILEKLRRACRDVVPEISSKPALKPKVDPRQVDFCKAIDDAKNNIKKAEEEIKRAYQAKSSTVVVPNEEALVKNLEDNLARVNVIAADLLTSVCPDNIHLEKASKSIKDLSEFMTVIAKGGSIVSGSRSDEGRKAFLDDLLGLCDASKKLCDHVKNDRKQINESAVDFCNKSSKILYSVSSDVDPAQQKEVISRAKEVGDSASRLATSGISRAHLLADDGQALCDAGRKCANATSDLLYTAKLVAPTIQAPCSQEALLRATDELSLRCQELSSTWPSDHASAKELTAEAATLEKLLENLRQDIKTGKLVKKKNTEKLTITDNPLKQMAMKILEATTAKAESNKEPANEKRRLADYCRELADAIKRLDLANARCRNRPYDSERRIELENEVLEVQRLCLQKRRGREHDKIVDFMDFMNDLIQHTEELSSAVHKCKPVYGKAALEDIKKNCLEIKSASEKLSSQREAEEDLYEDMLLIEHFAQNCESRTQVMESAIGDITDEMTRRNLREHLQHVTETCDLLRFAVNGGMAAVKEMALEEKIRELNELETMVDKVLLHSVKKPRAVVKEAVDPRVLSAFCSAVCSSDGGRAGEARGAGRASGALAALAVDLRACTPHQYRPQLNEHLKKLIKLLKAQAMSRSRRVAVWERGIDPQDTTTQEIMKELERYASHMSSKRSDQKKPKFEVLKKEDLEKLLSPVQYVKIEGSRASIQDKLQQQLQKLSGACHTIPQGVHRPESAARTLHLVCSTADSAAALADALPTADPLQNKRIEEAAQELRFVTYNLVKTAEATVHNPDHPAYRRKLMDALRSLNNSINKLARVCAPENVVNRECSELERSLQTQLGLLQGGAGPGPGAHCGLSYAQCMEALNAQYDIIQKLKSDQKMTREECTAELHYVTAAVCNSTEYAAQSAYLLSMAEDNPTIAQHGLVDIPRLQKLADSIHDKCLEIINTGNIDQAKHLDKTQLSEQVQQLQNEMKGAESKMLTIFGEETKNTLREKSMDMLNAKKAMHDSLIKSPDMAQAILETLELIDAVEEMNAVFNALDIMPKPKVISREAQARSDELMNHSRSIISSTQALVKQVKASEDSVVVWVMFDGSKGLLDNFEKLVKSVRENGGRAGIIAAQPVEEDVPTKPYLQIQEELANKWLIKPGVREQVKTTGMNGTKKILEFAEKMCEDTNEPEKQEMQQLIDETRQLYKDCSVKYNSEKASLLMDKLRELRKMLEWGIVTRVVEDFLDDEPLADLDLISDAEPDEKKRQFVLQRKIVELLAQVGKVKRTARLVADAQGGSKSQDLLKTSNEAELLAPSLVKAAEERIKSPNNQVVADRYKELLAQYNAQVLRVRELCDNAVDPMDFAQAATDTMQRVKEQMSQQSCPQTCAKNSKYILKLGQRVVEAGISSADIQRDPELKRMLYATRHKLSSDMRLQARASKQPDWNDVIAEMMRTTGEVESALGGETIFNKQPEPDQPIFAAALGLHAAVREWSARDNDIVAAAKRAAVLMARLDRHMTQDNGRELILTSKSIVTVSHEVVALAKKLARECTDVRITDNLLQACDRIPTISGQLKMLTTVKGSRLSVAHADNTEEDKEAMKTLVGNAQNLMLSIQEVVKAAASASVKIMSQKGGRNKWVRRNYY